MLPVFTEDSNGKPLSTFFFPGVNGFQGDVYNPVALIYKALSNNGSNRLDGTISVRYSPFKGVQINSRIATSYQALKANRFLPHSATGADFYRSNNLYLIAASNINSGSVVPQNAFSMYIKNDLTYTLMSERHTFQALVTSISQDANNRSITLAGYNTPSEYLSDPYRTALQSTIGSSKSINRNVSIIGQFRYMFDDRYNISGSLRREGDSAFGSRNRYGTFPSVSGFWRPSSEPFLKDRFLWLDQFKIRGSWGIAGRAPGSSAANAFTFSANAPFIDIQGITSDNIELVNLRWEKSTQSNLGTDISLWKGRLSLTVDFSKTLTKDLLQDVPLSPTSGFETIQQNFGTIRANVFEGSITGMIIAEDKWDLTTSFNISSVQTKILELPNNEPVQRDKTLDNGLYMTLVNEGDAAGTFYGLKYKGVYATDGDAYAKDADGNFLAGFDEAKVPMRWNNLTGYQFRGGDAIYEDINHDGLINKQDVVAIGNANPNFFGGAMIRLKYNKAWELFANFTYQYKFDIVNMAKMNTTNMYTNNNQTTAVMRRWRKQGDITDMPRALYGTGYNWVGSDRFIEDGTFIKCSTISLSYNLKKPMLDKIKFRSAKVALSVFNAFILTKYSGVDPTVSAYSNDPFYIGRDQAVTPPPITYTLGIWLNF